MHKGFYASGFLYHPPTQKILLRQQPVNSEANSWSLFGSGGLLKENAQETFQRVIRNLLHVKLDLKNIRPVYAYFCTNIHKNHSIVYAEVDRIQDFSSPNKVTCGWFTFKQILKLPLSKQAKHDLVVSQRVIDAKVRKRQGERTLE